MSQVYGKAISESPKR